MQDLKEKKRGRGEKKRCVEVEGEKKRREQGKARRRRMGEKERGGKTAVKSASEEEEVLADLRAAVAGRALIFVTEY